MVDFLQEEFWWLQRLGLPIAGQVRVAVSRWVAPSDDPPFDKIRSPVPVTLLGEWAAMQDWENVHRSLVVEGAVGGNSSIAGPLVVDVDVDVDVEEGVYDPKPSEAQLQKAKAITNKVVSYFSDQGVQEEDRRVYFSGHKGFHVEVVFPGHCNMHAANGFRARWDIELRKLRRAIGHHTVSAFSKEKPREIVIDPILDYIRLNTSVNRWGPLHSESRHRVIRVMESELAGITIDRLWALSRVN
jgi:hypothetical protein